MSSPLTRRRLALDEDRAVHDPAAGYALRQSALEQEAQRDQALRAEGHRLLSRYPGTLAERMRAFMADLRTPAPPPHRTGGLAHGNPQRHRTR